MLTESFCSPSYKTIKSHKKTWLVLAIIIISLLLLLAAKTVVAPKHAQAQVTATAVQTQRVSTATKTLPPLPIPPTTTAAPKVLSISDLIKQKSLKYKVSEALMHAVVKCESQYVVDVQSQYPDPTGPNGREDSWGLVQIHLPDHPTVTRAQAQNPEFALEFLASSLAKGKGGMWTCYRKLS